MIQYKQKSGILVKPESEKSPGAAIMVNPSARCDCANCFNACAASRASPNAA